MLESDMKKKICPIMTMVSVGKVITLLCHGTNCALWDEWKLQVKVAAAGGTIATHEPEKPYDPPQGDCGLRTVEERVLGNPSNFV